MKDKIRFKDLNGWLKTAIITSWIVLGYGSLMFIWGFLEGFFLA